MARQLEGGEGRTGPAWRMSFRRQKLPVPRHARCYALARSDARRCALLCATLLLRCRFLAQCPDLDKPRALQGFSHTRLLVGDPGLEPGTSSLSERRSNRL